MSMQLPLLLTSASSLLPESLGTITGKGPFGGIHSLLILLAVAPSMVMLVILFYELRGSRIDNAPSDDAPGIAEPLAEAEPENLTRFMRETIEQLNGIATALHNAIPEATRAPNPEASNRTAPSRHYLTFTLGDEQYAVNIENIHGVVEAIQLVAEPSMPPKIRKAIRLHGALVPVIDLGALWWTARRARSQLAHHRPGSAQQRSFAIDRRGSRYGRRRTGTFCGGDRTASGLRQPDPRRLHRRHAHARQLPRHFARHKPGIFDQPTRTALGNPTNETREPTRMSIRLDLTPLTKVSGLSLLFVTTQTRLKTDPVEPGRSVNILRTLSGDHL